jgi:hypothetical protein
MYRRRVDLGSHDLGAGRERNTLSRLAGGGALLLLLGLATVAGCRPNVVKRACMTVGGTGPLVGTAMAFRVRVYGAPSQCSGSDVASGAGAPLMARTYAKNEPITLTMSPGAYTLVLTTFADAAATAPLGQGCVVADVSPGAEVCFNLTINALSDLGNSGPGVDMSGADLGGGCSEISASFTAAAPAAPWLLENDAVWKGGSMGIQLNSGHSTIGGIFYTNSVATPAFDATMQYYVQGPDGIALVLATEKGGFAQNTSTGSDNGTGFFGMNGYAIKLDDFQNSGELSGNYVSFVRASDGLDIVAANSPVTIDCSCTRTLHVRFTGTHIHVDIDGVMALDADIPSAIAGAGATAFVPGNYYFGVTSASGWLVGGGTVTYLHGVASIDIKTGPPGICF